MQLTCPDCEKKLKVNDSAAGKKIRCPECGRSIMVPNDKSAIKKGPAAARKSTNPADDEDDDAEEPAKKSGMGMMLGLMGCGALVLFLICGGAGGGGVWYVYFRDPAPAAVEPGPQAKNNDPPAPAPVAKDIKAKLTAGRMDRFIEQVQMSVDYEVTDPKDGDHVGIFLHFASDQNNPELVKVLTPAELRGNPKGREVTRKFVPQPPSGNDISCDIVIRVAKDVGELRNGKELARLINVPIPSGFQGPPRVQLVNVIAKQNSTNQDMVDFSFECQFSGARPATYTIWFEAEFFEPVFAERKVVALTARVSKDIRPLETIVCSVQSPLPNCHVCDVYASDRQPGKGNLAKVNDVKILPAAPAPMEFSIALANAQVERSKTFPNLCKVSVEVKGKGTPKNVAYQCAAVFSVKGIKQNPVPVGIPIFANALLNGVTVEFASVQIPVGADDVCDIIIREQLAGNAPPAAELANVAVTGSTQPVALSKLRVYKVDDFTVQVQFDYEFTRPPDPAKWYTMMVQRHDTKEERLMKTGRIVWQFKGDQVQMKGTVNQKVNANQFGTARLYRVWAASGENQLDAVVRESTLHIAIASKDATPAGKSATLSNLKVDKLDDTHVRVQVDYEFAGDPDPKKGYAILVQRADVDEKKAIFNPIVRQELGDKWQKKGQVKSDVQADGKGKDYKVWLVETPNNIQSDFVTVTAGVAGRDDGNEPIQITAVKVASLGKKGSSVEISFKFAGLSKPNPKGTYAGYIAAKGGAPVRFFQVGPGQMAPQGTFTFTSTFMVGNAPEMEVWIVEVSAQNRLVSNKLKAEVK